MKIQNISDGDFILSPGSCPRGGIQGYLGAEIKFRPAVCPVRYLLLNHWTKFNQIWCVSYAHKWGLQRQILLCPAPRALGRVKRSNINVFQLQSQFQRFLFQTVCVFSQMKDTKHIRQDFQYVAWFMSQGWDFGAQGYPGGKKSDFQTCSCGISNRRG